MYDPIVGNLYLFVNKEKSTAQIVKLVTIKKIFSLYPFVVFKIYNRSVELCLESELYPLDIQDWAKILYE